MPLAFRRLVAFVIAQWPWIALASCAFMLGVAHYFQTFQGLMPCILCLKQREAYWIAGGIAIAGIAAGYTPWRGWAVRLLCLALAAAFFYGMGYAIYHMGAEYKWWKGPAACAIGGKGSAADIAAMLNGVKQKVVSCEEPVWWFPSKSFGLTMAGWNVIISLKLAVWSLIAAVKGRRA